MKIALNPTFSSHSTQALFDFIQKKLKPKGTAEAVSIEQLQDQCGRLLASALLTESQKSKSQAEQDWRQGFLGGFFVGVSTEAQSALKGNGDNITVFENLFTHHEETRSPTLLRTALSQLHTAMVQQAELEDTLKNEVFLVGSMKKGSVRATHVTDKG